MFPSETKGQFWLSTSKNVFEPWLSTSKPKPKPFKPPCGVLNQNVSSEAKGQSWFTISIIYIKIFSKEAPYGNQNFLVCSL